MESRPHPVMPRRGRAPAPLQPAAPGRRCEVRPRHKVAGVSQQPSDDQSNRPLLRGEARQFGRAAEVDLLRGRRRDDGRRLLRRFGLTPGRRQVRGSAAIWRTRSAPLGRSTGVRRSEPAERAVRPGGDRSQRLHTGRLGGGLHDRSDPAGDADPRARAGGRAHPRRRYDRAGVGQDGNYHRPYVRDDRTFGGLSHPAAIFFYSRDRGGAHPCRHLAGYQGILQADAYARFNDLYLAARKPRPIVEAACWAHGRRKLFVLADLAKSPLAIEAVRRIDVIFDVEREITGHPRRTAAGHPPGPCRPAGGVPRAMDARRTRE